MPLTTGLRSIQGASGPSRARGAERAGACSRAAGAAGSSRMELLVGFSACAGGGPERPAARAKHCLAS
eukprot:817441-Lingulodinium_polyedra.AAC.1